MSNRVFVSGIGIVTALGIGVEENFNALIQERKGLSTPQILPTVHQNFIVGEVSLTTPQLIQELPFSVPENTTRTAVLGLLAAYEAVRMADLTDELKSQAGLFNGTSVGGMDLTERIYPELESWKDEFGDTLKQHDCGYSSEFIAQQLGLKGITSTISTACSSSANTIMQAARKIKAGQLDCAIAGGTDALSVFTLNGFNSLMILDQDYCKPFDEDRKGLNLGEGAAFLVLESEESLKKRNGKPLGVIAGYGNSNDAYHQTASSPEGRGAVAAMEQALKVASLPASAIDYINAHGTGTNNNDLSESIAIQKVFNGQVPDFSSTKCFTGHTLAAAGAIEAVYSLLAIQHGVVYSNPNTSNPMDVIQPPVSKTFNKEIKHVLSNSFGFGGNSSSLVISGI